MANETTGSAIQAAAQNAWCSPNYTLTGGAVAAVDDGRTVVYREHVEVLVDAGSGYTDAAELVRQYKRSFVDTQEFLEVVGGGFCRSHPVNPSRSPNPIYSNPNAAPLKERRRDLKRRLQKRRS